MRRVTAAAGALLGLLGPAASAGAAAPSSCTACHDDVVAEVAGGVHAAVGFSCHDCHGGNPDPALADDLDAAMDAAWTANPYRGAPERASIPAFCGRCHSEPAIMRKFKPDARVDQEREYATSHHGEALARGDTRVASCVDCHGSHDIRRVDDPLAPVHPKRVAETCGVCHSDAERMHPLSVDQYALWRQSVHARALLEREDLSAPTCNDCHGNHGAAPPGLDSIAFVCGQCHRREAELFRASPKREGFRDHADYLVDAGEEGCVACHDSPPPRPEIAGLHAFGECSACHGNHGVVSPTVALFSPLPETPCFFCHEGPGAEGLETSEPERVRRHYREVRDQLLTAATALGLAGDDRFDWLVDRMRELEFHTRAERDGREAGLRPEFARMFAKFRIGKTRFTYVDPASGETRARAIIRCADCHVPAWDEAGTGAGAATGAELLARMQELTGLAARAERTLLAARRGGVETRAGFLEVDRAIDAQIELQVLVHLFSAHQGGAFVTIQEEGKARARAGLAAGRAALDELASRRRGLAAYLIVILAVLVALGLKIRSTA